MQSNPDRRGAMLAIGLSVAGAASALSSQAASAAEADVFAHGAHELPSLMKKIAAAPRRRDFKTVPMILDNPNQWDSAALKEVIGYRGEGKQVWNNTDIAGPWLNLMRNSINSQMFSFGHPDFLAVSATHASAHFALYEQAMWDKYKLADLTAGKPKSNTLIDKSEASEAAADFEKTDSAFGSAGNNIPTLQNRGVVFMACHNAIWEQADKLIAKGNNPDKLSQDALAAELTNHLVPGVILTPGIVGTIAELQKAGFHYAS